MNRHRIIEVVRALALPMGDYAIHASAVMVLHWLIDEAGDVDIVARGEAWRRALELGPELGPDGGTPRQGRKDLCVSLPALGVEVWSGWLEDDVAALIDGAEIVAGLPCVSLSDVLRFKLASDRPKDRPHIALLRAHLGR